MIYDRVIIGAGFAGLYQFLLAKKLGLKVALVHRDFGASHHFSGAFDIIDPRWQNPNLVPNDFPGIESALTAFIKAHPQHLYAQLAAYGSDPAGFAKILMQESKWFFEQLSLTVAQDDRLLVTLTPTGRVKPAAFALPNHALNVSEFNHQVPAAYVDFLGLQQEYPHALVTKGLAEIFSSLTVVSEDAIKVNPTSALWSVVHQFELNDGTLNDFAERLRPKLCGARILILPPVLGLSRSELRRQQLEERLGLRVIELLSGVPSVSGRRLFQHIQTRLAAYADEVVTATVTGYDIAPSKNILLKLEQAGVASSLETSKVVLASGKYLGGGLSRKNTIRESIFDLPLSLDGHGLAAKTAMTEMIASDAHVSQPFMRAGLSVGPHGEVNGAHDKLGLRQRVLASGHVLSGFDFTRDRCGFGVSLASGIDFSTK